LRFARIRVEKRHNYIRKVAEFAVQNFITNDRPNIAGLVLAGSADFKIELSQFDIFDQRLKSIIIATLDVSYGGENGFNQAIENSAESLSNVRFVHEQKLISRFSDEIAKDTKRFVFGLIDTIEALESGAVETLIIWESLEIIRIASLDKISGNIKTKYQTKSEKNFEVDDSTSLIEWLLSNYKKFGCALEFVTKKSQEGLQFVNGFGGIGGILRYQFDSFGSSSLIDEEDIMTSKSESEWDIEPHLI